MLYFKSMFKYMYNCFLILLIILILILLRLQSFHPKAIGVSPELLYKIVPPGTYRGSSIITPTEFYKNGVKTTHSLVLTKDNNKGIKFNQKIVGYDLITNKLLYEGDRIGKFYYKLNHGDHLFKEVSSYINGNKISNLDGYAFNRTSNSISFNLSGSRHLSSTKFKNVQSTSSYDCNKLVQEVDHINFYGLTEFSIKEEYTRV